MIKPNFFICGAPKAGTTSLHSYLSAHPDIFVPEDPKEPTHFATDLTFTRSRWADADAYYGLFEDAGNAKRIGESSASYFFSREAPLNIEAACPGARIILMLRNPVDLIFALHSELLFQGVEDIPDFAEALAAEPDRRAGRRLPAFVWPREALYYRDVATFAPRLRHYFEVFGRDRVQVILFDDFAADTPAVYRAVLEHLGVDPEFTTDFPRLNPNKERVFPGALQMKNAAPGWFRKSMKAVVPQSLIDSVSRVIDRATTRKVDRKPLDPVLRATLTRECEADIHACADLLQRDLSHWCTPAPAGKH